MKVKIEAKLNEIILENCAFWLYVLRKTVTIFLKIFFHHQRFLQNNGYRKSVHKSCFWPLVKESNQFEDEWNRFSVDPSWFGYGRPGIFSFQSSYSNFYDEKLLTMRGPEFGVRDRSKKMHKKGILWNDHVWCVDYGFS